MNNDVTLNYVITNICNGMPLEQVQQILGHKSPETTLEYAKIENSTVEHSYRTIMD